MSIFIFIVILLVIVLAHEFGHFIVAKRAGMRVDEFGIGFPPRLWSWKPQNSETTYSFNWIPFGGFVKIFGEDRMEDTEPEPRSFASRPKFAQASVIVAGVVGNIIFAWLLISIGFMSGFPTPVSPGDTDITNARLLITAVSDGSPAAEAGLQPGDSVVAITSNADALQDTTVVPQAVSDFISAHGGEQIAILYARGEERGTVFVTPKDGVVDGRPAIGITMDYVGTEHLWPHEALWQGAKTTIAMSDAIAQGFLTLITESVSGNGPGLSAVTGPVGIAGLVGDAASFGFAYLLGFAAFISLNLAIINIFPFPALDGGRLLFLIIEAIKGSRIKPAVTAWANGIGFVLLILLMVIVTFRDIIKLIN